MWQGWGDRGLYGDALVFSIDICLLLDRSLVSDNFL
jgi:hypothetical protein